ncbi:MAG TPA: GatB/YqeY domain-containing protein [Thermoleophilaceae bacterium]|nr:GatB/YqeY domain-containing protein [Thermoleophilaceae bacterium]
MSVVEQVQEDARTALKAGDRQRAGALRLVASELQRASKDGDGAVDEVEVLQRERKRRLESAQAYRDGGREDLAGTEELEAKLIEGYLPQQLGDDELATIVDSAIAESGASSPRDMGGVMKLVMGQVKGRADGKRVSAAVKEKLTA